MKTMLCIVFAIGNTERTATFIRPRSAKTPTYTGAARMVARTFCDHGEPTKPSEISVIRVSECCCK